MEVLPLTKSLGMMLSQTAPLVSGIATQDVLDQDSGELLCSVMFTSAYILSPQLVASTKPLEILKHKTPYIVLP